MRFVTSSRLRIGFLALIVIATCVTFSYMRLTTFASPSTVIGDQIVAFAENIQNGDLGTGRNPDTCIPKKNPAQCVQYSWGAGHGSKPGLTVGSCANWERPTKPAGAPQFSGPKCTQNSGSNGTIGLDCSGFTRWVYDLAYNKDVLGAVSAKYQISRPGVTEVATGKQQPGDLVYFAKDNDNEDSIFHVGIYIGQVSGIATMINAPHTYDSPQSKFNSTKNWTPAFVRTQSVSSMGTPFGYYRYTTPTSPTPTPTPTPPTSPSSKAVFLGMDTNNLYQLWETNGTASGTMELNSILGASSAGLSPGDITALGNGKAVFSGYDANNLFQVWSTDGTTVGTKELTTITNSVGAGRGGVDPTNFTTFKGQALFAGYDAKGNSGLWSTDGANISELTTGNVTPFKLTVFGNKVLFYGYKPQGQGLGTELWTTDGTPGGTTPLPQSPIALENFTTFGNQALFTADTDVFGDVGLWITDGTSTGTHAVQDVKKPGFAAIPSNITILGNKAVFYAMDTSSRSELWATDGTATGTQELTTITNGNTSLFPSSITALGSQALFMGYDTQGKRGLWVTNGTTSGTQEIITSDIAPYNFKLLGNNALFDGYDPTGGIALWITNGATQGTNELSTITNNYYGLKPSYITPFGKMALFNGYNTDASSSKDLWVTNGTSSGTIELTKTGVDPDNFAVLS